MVVTIPLTRHSIDKFSLPALDLIFFHLYYRNFPSSSLWFSGGSLKPDFGFPAFSGIARLTWLVDLFGNLTVTSASLVEEKENKYMKMTAHLLTQQQK